MIKEMLLQILKIITVVDRELIKNISVSSISNYKKIRVLFIIMTIILYNQIVIMIKYKM